MGNWHSHELDLSTFAGVVRVRFGFDTVTADNNDRDGWFIDDLSVEGGSAPPPPPPPPGDDSHSRGGLCSAGLEGGWFGIIVLAALAVAMASARGFAGPGG